MVYSTTSLPYNQTGNFIRNITELEEPRWDPVNPNILWGQYEFLIETLNVVTGEVTVIKDFSQDLVVGPLISSESVYRITMRDEEGNLHMIKGIGHFFFREMQM